ncbi:netrin-4 isoform X2 [Brienomyrus brachyistius]|uniref:netrin-4 isoform X2 n=1 Tax=Brienomyrus brachyistius TaxID=42636 RepID=UPI0020B3F552|nr:netrin-4 isoform X2 [Brienomyrus brachyistius]
MLSVCCALLFSALIQGGIGSRCRNHTCSALVGNLAIGRQLTTLSSCCGNRSSLPCLAPHCHSLPSHLGELLEQQFQLDLETQFTLTHVVAVFRSPCPLAMVLERSRDFTLSWEPLKFFSSSCGQMFGLPDDVRTPGALCTSRYSSSREVIFRALSPGDSLRDPYSPEALARLTLTNLRIRLLKEQSCPTPVSWQSSPPDTDSPPSPVYGLLAGGTCLCHGHAGRCQPFAAQLGMRPHGGMVQGRCVCAHHTAGEHCERCAPLFNDRPWRPANGSSGAPHPCKRCECHGHADSCRFSQWMWQTTGGVSGGVCDGCRHNTDGSRCQRCRLGYRRRHGRPMSSPHACMQCWCDSVGSVPVQGRAEGRWCHPRSGHCHCKLGVGGRTCSHCLPGYWGFGPNGCTRCSCPQNCDSITGHCQDRNHYEAYNIPIGGRIPGDAGGLTNEKGRAWSEELTISAIHYTAKCNCKEKILKSISDLCKKKYAYAIKASVLSAHDQGSHVEVEVKVRKVLRSGRVSLSQGTHSLFPLSWTTLGCTCPILNPGVEYLLAGPEEVESGRLLVTTQSMVLPWTAKVAEQVAETLEQGCP